MSHRIVAMGDGLWDLFPDGPRFGGAAANYACHASILGAEVYMVSGVGEDERGKNLLKVYDKHGVNTQLVRILKDFPTGVVTVDLTESGSPTFTIGEDSAWDHWQWDGELEEIVGTADALYFGTLGQRGQSAKNAIRKALALAKGKDIPRILDVNLRPPFYDHLLIRESIALCSVLKLSDEELHEVAQACELSPVSPYGFILQEIRNNYKLDLVVMTRGAEGAVLVSEQDVIYQSAFPSDVVDTVGAGDSFTASMTVGLLDRRDYAQILADACKVSGRVCSQAGAVPE